MTVGFRLSGRLPGEAGSCTILWLHCVAKEEALFEQAVQADPNDAYALYYRGVTHGRLGDYDAAATDLRAGENLSLGNVRVTATPATHDRRRWR